LVLKKNQDVSYYLQHIKDEIIDNPRGFVDLTGIFVNYTNKYIAKQLQQLYIDKYIIYIDEQDDILQYHDNKKILYEVTHDDNIYYYDQSHTIGTDIKQPQNGHVTILIDKTITMTKFAQALYRFRKINRGTYMSIIFIDDNVTTNVTTTDIYNILVLNENTFNENQSDGLKYQLLKTIIRKESNSYLEQDLKIESLYSHELTVQDLITRMNNNINGLSSLNHQYIFTKQLYDEINNWSIDKLKNITMGSASECQLSTQSTNESEIINQNEISTSKVIKSNYNTETTSHIVVMSHTNCELCTINTCMKMFKTDNIMINNKQIYISYNLRYKDFIIHESKYVFALSNGYNSINNTRISYVEFNDKILVELEDIVLGYYINKLPCYNIRGIIYNPELYFKYNINKYILEIDPLFIQIMGIENYKSPFGTKPIVNLIIEKTEKTEKTIQLPKIPKFGFAFGLQSEYDDSSDDSSDDEYDEYDENGFIIENKYNKNGYDQDGYNKDGYNKDGYNKDGDKDNLSDLNYVAAILLKPLIHNFYNYDILEIVHDRIDQIIQHDIYKYKNIEKDFDVQQLSHNENEHNNIETISLVKFDQDILLDKTGFNKSIRRINPSIFTNIIRSSKDNNNYEKIINKYLQNSSYHSYKMKYQYLKQLYNLNL